MTAAPTISPTSLPSTSAAPRVRWMGAALAGAAVITVAAEAVVASAWDQRGYSYIDDYVNFLGSRFSGVFEDIEISSPLWWVMSAAWIVSGALIATASVGLSRRLTGWRRRTTAALGVAQGIALVLFAVFPLGPETMANGTLPLYLLGAFVSIIAGNTLAVVTGLSGRALGLPRWLAVGSIVSGAIGLVNIPATYGWVPTGAAERISLYSYLLWALVLGVHLLGARRTTEG
jgi:hypothetical membrane protein